MLYELERVNNYINLKLEKEEKYNSLKELEEYAKENSVPIVTKEVAEYLRFMAEFNKSKNILEIGTAIGYSGIILAREAKKNNGKLTSIEIDENYFNISKENFKKYNIENVKQIFGDANEKLDELDEKYDFIFIDAAKGKYKDFFDKSFELLEENGMIFIDNILFRGFLYAEEYPKRYKTIVRKLDEFIDYLYKNHNFVLLPFGDGIGLVRKI